jgi:hypothetical protein
MAKAKRLGYEEFMGRFGWEAYDQDTPFMESPLHISSIPELRILVQAARHNCPDAFSIFLQQWLKSHGIEPPEGVFRPSSRRRGRRESSEAFGIHLQWMIIGKPSLSSTKLAKAFYGGAYNDADLPGRKEMIDKLRQAVERFEKRRQRQREWRGPRALTPPD